MIYSESRKMAVLAAYMGDLQRLDKKISEMNAAVQKYNTDAQKIWLRGLRSIQDKRKRFHDILTFVEEFPAESFGKEKAHSFQGGFLGVGGLDFFCPLRYIMGHISIGSFLFLFLFISLWPPILY